MGKKFDYTLNAPHSTFCIEMHNEPDMAEIIPFLKNIVTNQVIATNDYKYSKAAGAFVQGCASNWILIEFWDVRGVDDFIAYANEKWEREHSV